MSGSGQNIVLYEHRDETISIKVQAYLGENGLTVSGYDIGKSVKDHFGSSDYEYNFTVKPADLPALYAAMQLKNPEGDTFLAHLKQHYGNELGFSSLMNLLKQHHIKYDTFFWH